MKTILSSPRFYSEKVFCAVCLVVLISIQSAQAAESRPAEPISPGFEGAVVVEKPGARVPLDLVFNDEAGKPVHLADFFKKDRPVLLVMVYFQCPMLCNLTLNGIVKAVKTMSLLPGRDYEIVTVSFDPREGPELAAAKKANYIQSLGKPEAAAGWHFLTSPDPAAARTLGDALGFGYKLDPKGEMYLHQAAIYLCSPDGRVTRTVQGVEFESDMLHDSLVNAAEGKISSGLFGVALSCGFFHFDPATGKYALAAMAIMRATGILTVIIIGLAIGTMVYRENRKRPAIKGIGD